MAFPTNLTPRHTDSGASATSLGVLLPNGSDVVGRLVIVFMMKDQAANAFSWPAGWTQIFTPVTSSAQRMEARYRIIDGTEGFDGTDDSITITWSGSVRAHATAVTYSSWHGTTPPQGATATLETGHSDPPSLSPSWGLADTQWLVATSRDGTQALTSYPSGYDTGNWAQLQTNIMSCGFARRNLAAATEDPDVFTIGAPGSGNDSVTVTVAVRPSVWVPQIVMADS